MSPRWRRALRAVLSIAIVWVVIAILPSGSLQSALAQASPATLAVAFVVHFLAHMVAALKWRMLMGPDVELSAAKAFKAQFSGLMGNISPLGVIGGDIIRASVAISESGRASTIMLTSIVDRVVDTTALLVLTLIGLLLIPGGSDVIATMFRGRLALFATGLVLVAVALA
ncbi:MAG TPA: flippase-like domain-containing protein, partial [Rhodothermia bacterium]